MTYTVTQKRKYIHNEYVEINHILENNKIIYSWSISKNPSLRHDQNLYENLTASQPEVPPAMESESHDAPTLEFPPAVEHVYHSFGNSSPVPDDNERTLEDRKAVELEAEPGCFSACLNLLKGIFCCNNNNAKEDISQINEIVQNAYDKALRKGKDTAEAYKKADEKAYSLLYPAAVIVAYPTYNGLIFINNNPPNDSMYNNEKISESYARIQVRNKMMEWLEENAILVDEDISSSIDSGSESPNLAMLIQNAARRAMDNILKKLFDDNQDSSFAR